MTEVLQQDSNATGLRVTREVSPGSLSGTDIWAGLEPNSYKDFGATFKKTARAPINANRQQRKGVTTDLDSAGSFQCDLTYQNFQANLAESVFFADMIKKSELAVATVSASTGYEPASGGDTYIAGDLVFGSGFAHAANNGLHVVTGTPGASSVEFSGMAAETGATGTICKVGHQFASGDLTIVSASSELVSSAPIAMSGFGLSVGEWIFVGDDDAAKSPVSNDPFWARVLSVSGGIITLDKTEIALVDDAGTSKTVRIYFGRIIKNQLAASIKKYTYQIERSLSYADDSNPSDIQGEYLPYSFFDQIDFTFNTADKITFDAAVVAAKYETRLSSDGLKPGSRPTIPASSAFNTATNMRRVGITKVGNQLPLFAFLSDFSITIQNNISANKALTRLGAFSLSAGEFSCSTAGTAYFADVSQLQSVADNDDVTVDAIITNKQQAIFFDLPLVALDAGKGLNVVANQPITLALTSDAGTGADVNVNADYTMMMGFFDYIPIVAEGTGV